MSEMKLLRNVIITQFAAGLLCGINIAWAFSPPVRHGSHAAGVALMALALLFALAMAIAVNAVREAAQSAQSDE